MDRSRITSMSIFKRSNKTYNTILDEIKTIERRSGLGLGQDLGYVMENGRGMCGVVQTPSEVRSHKNKINRREGLNAMHR